MPELISPYQSRFVSGRSIHENIIITQEIIHSMRNKKGKKGYFAIKVDLSKAYDKLSWDFIWRILEEFHLQRKMIDLILHGVTSVKTNIKWNSAVSKYFRPVDEGKWKTIKAGKKGRAAKKEYFHYIVEQVSNKLTAWKGKQLAFMGRVTLAKSVIETLLIYPMMITIIPKSCIDAIHKLQRSFIWVEIGTTCMMKIGWEMQTNTQDLWCEVLWGKSWPLLETNCYWDIGDVSTIKAWEDKWVDSTIRIKDLNIKIHIHLQTTNVADMGLN
ncbi:unnamed protein product [Vicia faba]|uniref:Reverse transcriptase domain-containing protein n=1 Tax=Vicia faba TaxID=3906 RepID=A0AAV0ZA26_VICFA|nr:unnamed protein product [Vicia faba]